MGKIQPLFLSKFLPASLTSVSDYNSDMKQKRSENGRSCMVSFVRYHPVTADNSNQ
jgi:hypothetical protein